MRDPNFDAIMELRNLLSAAQNLDSVPDQKVTLMDLLGEVSRKAIDLQGVIHDQAIPEHPLSRFLDLYDKKF